ncbi:MAG TPA: phage tail protein [Allosphingosinicella sp.]
MATLVLAAAGSVVGGPVGGAIGAIVGQQIDARLFAPKPRQGPRLGDLAVQTSSYGSQIPKLFGTMRVAGTVIWATDVKEERSRSGGGKGQPKTVNYSYSANFAVALSARPVLGVGRIWADGKLLRGAAGDFKTATGYRLHLGGDNQAVDPLIASVEGAGETPAYRGLAYAVFEDFQLADYGNRIPSLTFEVEADAGGVTAGAVAAALAEGLVTAGETVMLGGYAAGGDSLRSAIAALAELEPLSLVDDGETLRLASRGAAAPVILGETEPGTATAGAGGRSEWLRRSGDSVPAEATLAYYEPSRDYQTGLQRASRPGAAVGSDRRAVAAALDAGTAKALVARRLETLWAERRSAKLHLGWSRLGLRAGSQLRVGGRPGLWKLARWTLDRMVLTLELSGVPAAAPASLDASPGRPVDQPDLPHGPTSLLLLDLPLLGEELPRRPRLLAAAAGAQAGWRRAELLASFDGGGSWIAAGATAPPAIIGTALDAPAGVGPALFDASSRIEIELLNEAMWLENRSDAALAAGANLAMLGEELIQFGVAEPLGGRRFRLARLLRGRRGTEWAASLHAAGDPFVLIEAESLAAIDAPLGSLGGEARLLATGLGDPDGVLALRQIGGEAMRPPSPVHLRAEMLANGDMAIGWVRRSRNGWVWLSGSDTPLGEETESYRLTLAGEGFERSLTLPAPAYLYTAAEQAADGLAGPLTIAVVQLGTSAASRPASRIIG